VFVVARLGLERLQQAARLAGQAPRRVEKFLPRIRICWPAWMPGLIFTFCLVLFRPGPRSGRGPERRPRRLAPR